MLRIIFLFVFFCFHYMTFSQNVSTKLIKEYEDTLKIIANEIMFADSEEKRQNASDGFSLILSEVLNYEKSFKHPFDSLKTISILNSPDNQFRLFNWILKKDNGSHKYYAFIQYKKKKKIELIELIDNSKNIRNSINKNLDSKNWLGCLYYKIIYIKKTGRKYYTLLGWDGHDSKSTKKIIEVLTFGGKNKIKFGLPIFKLKNKESQKRFILESDAKTSFTLKYDKNIQSIVFSNLIPIKKDLKGMEEYYIPDGSFNSFEYKSGKWYLMDNIDARNKNKKSKYKKPKMGLINK